VNSTREYKVSHWSTHEHTIDMCDPPDTCVY